LKGRIKKFCVCCKTNREGITIKYILGVEVKKKKKKWRPQIKTSQGVNNCDMMAGNTRYNFC